MIRLVLQGLVFVIFFPAAAFAACYLGIGPLDSLADLKQKFPNADFYRENPAWAQEHDALYTITGDGISGTIIVNFYDTRPWWKKKLAEERDGKRKELIRDLAGAPDENMTVSWIRWIPRVPFPLAHLIAKIGRPQTKDFSPEDYQPYKEWKKRGIRAYLTDDEKKVVRINYTFTKKERDRAWRQRYGKTFPGKLMASRKN